MSDLISRSALIEILSKYKFGAIESDSVREYIKETVLDFVREQPTAYDVEKVVAELEELKNLHSELSKDGIDFEFHNGCEAMCEDAIDIVKAGGVE